MFYGTTVENLKTTSPKTITDTKITQFAQFAQFAQCNGTALTHLLKDATALNDQKQNKTKQITVLKIKKS